MCKPKESSQRHHRVNVGEVGLVGCAGSSSMSGRSPLRLGTCRPSSSASTTVWITVNCLAARSAR